MLFKKNSDKITAHPFPGKRSTVEGLSALQRLNTLICGQNTGQEINWLTGQGVSLSGQRAATLLSDSDSAMIVESLRTGNFWKSPQVIQLMLNASAENPTGYVALDHLRKSGFFQFIAKNVQEMLDFTLIARRVAELALVPGVVAFDFEYTGKSIQTVHIPDEKLVKKYLGSAETEIDAPTESQRMVFGEKRRRVPKWLDFDRPLGLVDFNAGELHYRAAIAQQAFFESHLPNLIQLSIKEFAGLTGRNYEIINRVVDAAEYLVITNGAISDDAERVAENIRTRKKIRLTVLSLNQLRPFPSAAMTHLLKGKKAVTVLECSNANTTDNPTILQEIRSAIECAEENGSVKKNGSLPHPDFAVFAKPADRPVIFSGIFQMADNKPGFAELSAAIENMLPGGEAKKRYYLGVTFAQSNSRYPMLEALSQRIERSYPQLEKMNLSSRQPALEQLATSHFRQIKIVVSPGELLADVNVVLAKTLADSTGMSVRTFAEIAANRRSQAYSIEMTEDNKTVHISNASCDAMIFSQTVFANNLSALKNNGLAIIQSTQSGEWIWKNFSETVRRQIQEKQLKIWVVNTATVNTDIPGYAKLIRQLTLCGAVLAHNAIIDGEQQTLLKFLRQRLAKQFSDNPVLLEELTTAVKNGMSGKTVIDWQSFPEIPRKPATEIAAPLAIRQQQKKDGSVFDPARFWDSVGYFYATGTADQTLTDPFLATASMPGSSAAARDLSDLRSEIPQLIPENCTACGSCWINCPESALPVTVQDVASFIKTGIADCQQRGHSVIQLQRVADPLGKVAYRIFAADELREHRTLGSLLDAAFAQLVEKMNLTDDALATLQGEFAPLSEMVRHFPIVRTKTFFDDPQQQQKNSGMMFSLTVNPSSCSACGGCVRVCPENALEMVAQNEDIIANYRRNWQFSMNLPENSIEQMSTFVTEENPISNGYLMMNRRVYHSQFGGDNIYPGSGSKTAAHLIFASAEMEMQPRIAAFLAELDSLISTLKTKAQNLLTTAVQVNDFEVFGQKLAKLESGNVSIQDVTGLLDDKSNKPKLDSKKLEQLSQTIAEIEKLRDLHKTRANLSLLFNGDRIAIWGANYPHNAFPFPSLHAAKGDISKLATEVFNGIVNQYSETFAAVRRATLIAKDEFTPSKNAPDAPIGWQQFSQTEKALVPPLVVLIEESTLPSQSLTGFAKMLSGHFPVKLAILNGNPQTPPETGLWALTHPETFVLQSTPGVPAHSLTGLRRGFRYPGAAVFHLYTAEPFQHGIDTNMVVRQERLAVATRAFPLFLYDPSVAGSFSERLDLSGNIDYSNDWVQQKQQLSQNSRTVDNQLTVAHWAVSEGRFRNEFRALDKSEWQDNQLPLAEYLALEPQKRAEFTAVITLENLQKQKVRIRVSEKLVAAAEQRLRFWQTLQELAGTRAAVNRVIIDQIRAEADAETRSQTEAVAAEYSAQLAALDAQHWQIYHQRLTEKLIRLYANGSPELLQKSLREFAGEND